MIQQFSEEESKQAELDLETVKLTSEQNSNPLHILSMDMTNSNLPFFGQSLTFADHEQSGSDSMNHGIAV